MSKLTKPLSTKRLVKLADSGDPQTKRLIWELCQARFLLRQTSNLLEHWGEDSWEIITIRDALIKELSKTL